MTKIFCSAVLMFLLVDKTYAQTIELLRQKIENIISTKDAYVGVSISGDKENDTLSINGTKHFPMQSVFKFHIALKVLSEIDKKTYSLDQKIEIKKSQLLPGLYSPLRDKYPQGVSLAISEILEYTISQSDNVGCDVLLQLVGGPTVVEDYFSGKNFKDL